MNEMYYITHYGKDCGEMQNRYASHPNEVKNFDTTRLREEFLIEQLFTKDELVTVYSHVDRYCRFGCSCIQRY